MVTSAERGREARQRLLAAAGELVVERGWSGVTTRVLAERAGVAAGAVHYHFSSVRSVLVQAASEAARALVEDLRSALADATSADDVVAALVQPLDRYDGTDPVSVLLVEAYLAAARDDELRHHLGEVVADLRTQVARCLDAQAVPEPTGTAAVLVAAADGVMLHRALMPGPAGAELEAVLRRLLPLPASAS